MLRRHSLLVAVLLTAVAAGSGLLAGSAPWAAARSSDAATVRVAHDATYGAYLTDGAGVALYIAAEPGQVARINGSGDPPIAACNGICLQVWPPLTTDGAPLAGDGVEANLLGTTEAPNGGTQVTYAGWPLYTFAADTGAGSTFGQAVAPPQGAATGAAWYLMAPDGTVILTKPPE